MLIGGIAMVVRSVMQNREPDLIGDRLSQYTERPLSLEELELQQPFFQRVIVPMTKSFLSFIGKYGPKQSAERLKVSLQQAGNPGNITPVMFTGIRMALCIILLIFVGGDLPLDGIHPSPYVYGDRLGHWLPDARYLARPRDQKA